MSTSRTRYEGGTRPPTTFPCLLSLDAADIRYGLVRRPTKRGAGIFPRHSRGSERGGNRLDLIPIPPGLGFCLQSTLRGPGVDGTMFPIPTQRNLAFLHGHQIPRSLVITGRPV